MERFLIRVNRITAYLLIVLWIFIMITGYRQVGHFTFISRGLASSLHQIYLNIAFIFCGAVHGLTSIRRALIRNKIRGIFIDILLIILGVVFVGGFAYFTFS